MKLMLRLLLSTFVAATLAACAMEGDEATFDEAEPIAEVEGAVEVPTAEEGAEEGARTNGGTPCVVASPDGARVMVLPCPPPPPDEK